MIGLNEISLFIFLGCIILYFSLIAITLKFKKPIHRDRYKRIYKNWVKNRLKDKSLLIAVQTIRNFIMVNSIFISALLLLLGLIIGLYGSFTITTEDFMDIAGLSVGIIQVALNIFMILFSLLNFIFSIRMLNRTNFLITSNVEGTPIDEIEGLEVMQGTFLSAQNYWMLGIRGLYFLIPTLFWFLNPLLFAIASIIITIYLIAFQDIWFVPKK